MDMKVNYSYPNNPDYIYESLLSKVNLDQKRREDIASGHGFIISQPNTSIKKDLKDPNGIFSTKYGQTLQDANPFIDRYRCQCGHLKSRIHHGITCNVCNTKCKFVGDDFECFGWIVLKDEYYIIHPNLYKSIEFFLGGTKVKFIDNILKPIDQKDENGYSIEVDKPKNEPYYGLGIMDFKDKFQEIMDYYLTKNPGKIAYYNDIMENKDNIFIQSIPVYTTHLRPVKSDGDSLFFEGTNAIYNMISKLAAGVNRDDLKIFRKKKPKNQLLYDLHKKYMELYKELELIIAGKKGSIRELFGGRFCENLDYLDNKNILPR